MTSRAERNLGIVHFGNKSIIDNYCLPSENLSYFQRAHFKLIGELQRITKNLL